MVARLQALVARRIAQQIARRTPYRAPPLSVSPHRLYILPSAAGALFALTLVVMLLGATHFGSNLAFVLTFWLAGVALVSMHRAHRNLSGLVLEAVDVAPVFVDQTADLTLTLKSAARRQRRHLAIAVEGQTPVHHDIDAETQVVIALAAPRRGRIDLPALVFESRYPLGLFRCWTRLAPAGGMLVYPRPAGLPLDDRALPGHVGQRPGSRTDQRGDTEFVGHRAYRDGDGLRDVDWKQSARSPNWLIREYDRPSDRAPRVFDYHALSYLPGEARLSQLARWVLDADGQGLDYTLVLPQARLGPAGGATHRRACLEALALAP